MSENEEIWIQIGQFKRFKLSDLSTYSISPVDHKSLRLTMKNKEILSVYEKSSVINAWVTKLDALLSVQKL